MKKIAIAMWVLPVTAILYVLSAFTVYPQQPAPVPVPAKDGEWRTLPEISSHQPTARIMNAKGEEVCEVVDGKLILAPDAQGGGEVERGEKLALRDWKSCANELFNVVMKYRADAAQAKIKTDTEAAPGKDSMWASDVAKKIGAGLPTLNQINGIPEISLTCPGTGSKPIASAALDVNFATGAVRVITTKMPITPLASCQAESKPVSK